MELINYEGLAAVANYDTKCISTGWTSVMSDRDRQQLKAISEQCALYDKLGQEGIGMTLLKPFINAGDLLLRIGNTFKTNLLKFHRDLKRSDMRTYWENHMIRCKTVEGRTYDKYMKLQVPVPSGMKGTYYNATNGIYSVYTSLALQSHVNGVANALVNIRRRMSRGDMDCQAEIAPIHSIVKQRYIAGTKSVALLNRIFTNDRTTPTLEFSKVYASMKDLQEVRKLLVDKLEPQLLGVGTLIATLDDIESTMADITSVLSNEDVVNTSLVKTFVDLIHILAESYDMYGINSLRQVSVEHNHIGVLDNVWGALGEE